MSTTEHAPRLTPPEMTPEDAEAARLAQRFIMTSLDHSRAARITLVSDTGDAPSVAVPAALLRFMADLLGLMSAPRAGLRPARPPRGSRKLGAARRFLESAPRPVASRQAPRGGMRKLRAAGRFLMSERQTVVIMPSKRELSTVEAAHMHNVSRPFVIKEIEAGRLKHRKVGTHRRIALEDLMAYALAMHAEQRGALERLARNAEELGLDY